MLLFLTHSIESLDRDEVTKCHAQVEVIFFFWGGGGNFIFGSTMLPTGEVLNVNLTLSSRSIG